MKGDAMEDPCLPNWEGNPVRVIQIHPTLECNLRCRHCYSSSGPGFKGSQLAVGDLVRFLEYARGYGFETLSVSGGEPFMYRELDELLGESHQLKNRNMVASNGMLLKSARARKIIRDLDLVAISVDGDESIHDAIRNQIGAFQKMKEGVQVLREEGSYFGFIHTITERSWEKFIELAEFAHSMGARLLQMHPLEQTGRAVLDPGLLSPSQECLHKVFILASYLRQKYSGVLHIQLDFLHREHILDSPVLVSAAQEATDLTEDNFPEIVRCLVVDANGSIFPMSYGFDDYFCLGNIADLKKGTNVIDRFIAKKGAAFCSLIHGVFQAIAVNDENDMIPWTEIIVRESHEFQKACSA
jgi:MoaA/NifB/PqqE/SkfB family radical SAM enzyme